MSLLITAVAPDGIVLGADSAVTRIGFPNEIRSLSGFDKIVPVPRWTLGISVAGAVQVGPREREIWISDWLRDYVENMDEPSSFPDFVNTLAETLSIENTVGGESVIHVAGWINVKVEDTPEKIPQMVEIAKKADDAIYSVNAMLSAEFINEIIAWRRGSRDSYPLRLMSAGIPAGYAGWVGSTGVIRHREWVGQPIPAPEITSVAEYVRFLIRSIAELHRIARQHAFVAEPVETLLLFPESKNMMSTRY